MILLVFIGITSFALLFLVGSSLRKTGTDEHTRIILKNLSILELGMSALSIMLGLFLFFDLLEVSTQEDFTSFKPELIRITTATLFGVLHFALFIVLFVRLAKRFPR